MIAGGADQLVEAGGFAAKNDHAVAGEVELVVVGGTTFIEANDPDVLLFQLLQGAYEVDDAGDAEVFRCSRTGLHGHGTQRRGATLGEHYAIDARSVGNAKKRAEVLRIFNAIKGEEQARLGGIGRSEEVFNGQGFLLADKGNDSLMCRSASEMCELLARLLAHTDAGLFAVGDEARKAFVVTFRGNNYVIEA